MSNPSFIEDYMHMVDGTETAGSFGLSSDSVPIPFTEFPEEVVTLPAGLAWREGEGEKFLALLYAWAGFLCLCVPVAVGATTAIINTERTP